MADISQIKLPDNNTYNFKDTLARGLKMYYGLCTSAADTAAKVVTVGAEQDFKLTVGALLMVKFTKSNSASNVTLNVNSTGAKGIYYNNGVYTGNSTTVCGYANANFIYMYGGSNWIWVGHGSDNSSGYSAMSVAEGQTATATSSRVMRADYLKQIIQYHAVPSGQGVPAGGTAGQVLAKVDGTDYNTGWIDAPSGGDEMFYYVTPRRNPPTPKPSEFVYPGDVDLEFYLQGQSWALISADMQALFPSVDLSPTYHYKQKKMTNSAGTYLYKTARWQPSSTHAYINFVKIPEDTAWRVRDMNVRIGAITNSTFTITSDALLVNVIKAVYACKVPAGYGLLKGYLDVKTNSIYTDIVPVTGIVKSETTFEFETYIKNGSNKMYLIHASYNAGTWTVTKVEIGTLA